MRIGGHEVDGDIALELQEVAFMGSPDEIRSVARFLLECADGMDADAHWGHKHYQDADGAAFLTHEIIVAQVSD